MSTNKSHLTNRLHSYAHPNPYLPRYDDLQSQQNQAYHRTQDPIYKKDLIHSLFCHRRYPCAERKPSIITTPNKLACIHASIHSRTLTTPPKANPKSPNIP